MCVCVCVCIWMSEWGECVWGEGVQRCVGVPRCVCVYLCLYVCVCVRVRVLPHAVLPLANDM